MSFNSHIFLDCVTRPIKADAGEAWAPVRLSGCCHEEPDGCHARTQPWQQPDPWEEPEMTRGVRKWSNSNGGQGALMWANGQVPGANRVWTDLSIRTRTVIKRISFSTLKLDPLSSHSNSHYGYTELWTCWKGSSKGNFPEASIVSVWSKERWCPLAEEEP